MIAKKDFYVVGIGASAGGLDAIQQLFDNLPNDTGIAFVIIQHLSPDFKSLMPELLGKHTGMKIFTAEDKQEIFPNCIYLNQRNKNLHIKGNKLYLLDKGPKHNLNLPIDIFFHTLGEEYKEKSVGVILSGTGSDGSRGIKSIKEAGGTIMVQDPNTAQFDGMPNTAIGTNLADFILSLQNMAEVIYKIPGKKLVLTTDDSDHSNDVIFYKVLEEIHKTSGIDFRQYKKNTLIRRLEKRMNITNIDHLYDYYVFLKSNSNEKNALKQDFLIGVTSFFRDIEAFEALKNNVIPNLCENSLQNEPIRVWVAGCSTGEEVFSIAILIDDYIRTHKLNREYKIFATDVDTIALNTAGQGNFHINIINELDKYYLDNYFVKTGDKIQINKRIREKIVFSNHNLMKDPPFIRVDLISCRNLLIYLDNRIQQKIFMNFQFALNKFGYLFLGNSESLGENAKYFKVIEHKWKIFQNISDTKHIPAQVNPEDKIATISYNSPIRGVQTPEYRFKENPLNVFNNYLSKRFSPSTIFIDKDYNILFLKGDAGKKLIHSEGLFQNNLLKIVSTEIAAVIRNGIRRLETDGNDIIVKNVVFKDNEDVYTFDLSFHKPLDNSDLENVYLIHFSEDRVLEEDAIIVENVPIDEVSKQRLDDLENELKFTKGELQNVVEELETSNEELQSSNEELMASNEELQSTNEELQSVNEELYTVNAELQEKNKELQLLNNDITNLLDSTEIGTLFLDLELRIRKYTPALHRIYNLHDSDIGRPIASFASNFSDDIRNSIINNSKKALDKLSTIELEIVDYERNHTLVRIIPFVTADKKIDGVVITFIDVTKIKQAEQQIGLSEKKYRNLFDNMTEGFAHAKTIIDKNGIPIDWEYITVNPAFEKLTGLRGFDIIGKRITEISPTIKDDLIDWIGIYGETALTGKEHYLETESKELGIHYAVHTFQPKKGEWAATFWDITDRLSAEKELKQSENRLKEAQSLALLGNFEDDFKTNNVWWSEQTYKIFGFEGSKKPPTQEIFLKQLSKEDATLLRNLTERAMLFGEDYDITYKYYMPVTSELKYIYAHVKVEFCEGQDKASCLKGTIQDVTKQKLAEINLVESENKFKSIFNSAGIGIATVSLDGKPTSANPELERFTGYSANELIEMSFPEFTHPEDVKIDLEKYNKLISGEINSYRLDKRYITKAGETVWGQLTTTLVKNNKNKVLYAVGLVKDITKQKEIESKLNLEKKFRERIAETSPNGIYIYDLKKGINVFTNKRYAEILGYKLDEINAFSDSEFNKLFHPDDLEIIANHMGEMIKGKEYVNIEYRFKHKNGHWIWCYSIDTPFERDEHGNVISFIGSFIDLTERKLFEDELKTAKKNAEIANIYKNQFLANMSHEIRTPMNGIVGFADLLKEDKLTIEKRNKFIEIIKNSSNQLLLLINDIIDISKIEAGELQLIYKPCNLHNLFFNLESTFNEIKKQKNKEHIHIVTNIPNKYKDLVIETDPLRLQQIMTNLINNSLKFSETGTIEFGFDIIGDNISFFVKDQGIGIPKDKINLIFNRFEQLEQKDPGKNEGTGLGLSITKGIIDLLKGEFSVTSILGEGTTFQFYFACKTLENKELLFKSSLKKDVKKKDFENKTVLIAEDDIINIEYFKSLFNNFSMNILYANNGKEAIEVYHNHPEIEVVLMDIRMPVMDGSMAAKIILESNPKAKIIAQTANAMANDAEKYLKDGFVDYIKKPIDKDELLGKLHKLLD